MPSARVEIKLRLSKAIGGHQMTVHLFLFVLINWKAAHLQPQKLWKLQI